MKISLLHATLGRPQKAVAAMRAALAAAAEPGQIEYIVAVESNDAASIDAFARTTEPRIIANHFNGSAPAWDAAAKASTGDLLVQMQDDLELPQGWDRMLLDALEAAHIYSPADPVARGKGDAPHWSSTPCVVRVSDGHRKDSLLCTAICTRARYQQVGEFLHAGYQSVYSDGEFSLRAYADQRAGRCTVIDARDIIFLHRHHYHDKSVPMDATYAHENSADAYARGLQLFNRRNPGWRESGLVDWM